MVNVIVSIDFLQFLYKHRSYRIEQFENAGIKLDDYLFFDELLTRRSKIHLDISASKLVAFKDPATDLNTLTSNEKEEYRVLKLLRNNTIEAAEEIFNSIRNLQFSSLSVSSLPHFVILGAADKDYCKRIEEAIGVPCFSIQHNKVNSSLKKVELKRIRNTRDSLYYEISLHSFNALHLEDSQLVNRIQKEIEIAELLKGLFAGRRVKLKTPSLSFSISYKNGTEEWKEKFKKGIHVFNEQNGGLLKFECHNSAKHDRYIFTNTLIIVIGNSVNQSGETHFTTYPHWQYLDYFN